MTDTLNDNQAITIEQAQAYIDKHALGRDIPLTARYIDDSEASQLIYTSTPTPMKGGVHSYRIIRATGDVMCVSTFGSGQGTAVIGNLLKKLHADTDFLTLLQLARVCVGNVRDDSYYPPLWKEQADEYLKRRIDELNGGVEALND